MASGFENDPESVDLFAQEDEPEVITMTIEEAQAVSKTTDDVTEIDDIYRIVFPDEYHYIEEFQQNGLKEMDDDVVLATIFYETREYNDVEYTLQVMNNGAVARIQEDDITPKDQIQTRARSYWTSSFVMDDGFGYTQNFVVTYMIDNMTYDSIESWESYGDYALYSWDKHEKFTENSKGPAHIYYTNCTWEIPLQTQPLWDMGVLVGRDEAQPFMILSEGWDMTLWTVIHHVLGW